MPALNRRISIATLTSRKGSWRDTITIILGGLRTWTPLRWRNVRASGSGRSRWVHVRHVFPVHNQFLYRPIYGMAHSVHHHSPWCIPTTGEGVADGEQRQRTERLQLAASGGPAWLRGSTVILPSAFPNLSTAPRRLCNNCLRPEESWVTRMCSHITCSATCFSMSYLVTRTS